jgi:hypothetical protein
LPFAGAIADRVKGLIPITCGALTSNKNIGEAPLQRAIDLAKETVTGVVVAETVEQNYPLVVIDYIAKIAVIEICPMARDFWMNQSLAVSATGTNETLTYTDRANVLDELRKELVQETRLKQPEIAKLIGFWRDNGKAVPNTNSAAINPFHLTPSPEEFPRPYRQTQYS